MTPVRPPFFPRVRRDARRPLRTASAPALSLAIALTLSFASCAGAANLDRTAAEGALREQAAKWNAGDLPGFVETYHDGPELTFLGGRGLVRGRQDLLAQYERGYPNAAARGQLSFQTIDFQPLGRDHALLLGRFAIERQAPAKGESGFFTLVLVRRGDSFAILHDHTSPAATSEPAR